ncbi:hypothetical protein NUW54_g6807 [Trametes sanguinea]|uniref:Uncharacterized protein n=1 Tax=Trametes sanguinea TaxID=158606 RepID=A0ACC1PTZ4_9APHY|nr:hypothetical protein NUW54_g6807 [Trametes sanguinea]
MSALSTSHLGAKVVAVAKKTVQTERRQSERGKDLEGTRRRAFCMIAFHRSLQIRAPIRRLSLSTQRLRSYRQKKPLSKSAMASTEGENENVLVGVIGGSGLYHLDNLTFLKHVNPQTPWGYASSPITICALPSGTKVAFLARRDAADTCEERAALPVFVVSSSLHTPPLIIFPSAFDHACAKFIQPFDRAAEGCVHHLPGWASDEQPADATTAVSYCRARRTSLKSTERSTGERQRAPLTASALMRPRYDCRLVDQSSGIHRRKLRSENSYIHCTADALAQIAQAPASYVPISSTSGEPGRPCLYRHCIMSDSAALVEFYQQTAIYNYIGFATFVATIYDWLLCLGQETEFIWPQSRTGASALYFFNRYLYIFVQLLSFIYLRPMSYAAYVFSTPSAVCQQILYLFVNRCTFLLHLNWVVEYIMLIGPAVFSCLRVYALTGRNTVISGLTLFFGLMPFVLNMATIYAGHVVNEPMPIGCTDEYTLPDTVTIAYLVVDVQDQQARQEHHRETYPEPSDAGERDHLLLVRILERQARVRLDAQLLLNAISLANTALDTGSYTENFIDLLTSVLISRFLLNLRATSRNSHTLSTPSFVASQATFTTLPHFVSDLAGPVHSSLSSSSSTLESQYEDELATSEYNLEDPRSGC